MSKTKVSLIDRFWQRVNKNGPVVRVELGPCWIWTAGTTGGGYGVIKASGVRYAAHRLSWKIHNGPIPKDLCGLHHCDNPPCVRPDHLFLGTKKDNAVDMFQKGRRYTPHGSETPKAKLNEQQVREIRQLSTHTSNGALAREYGLHPESVRDIVNRTSWRHVL